MRGVAILAYPQVSRYLGLAKQGARSKVMETKCELTEIEQQERLHIVELLLPHFGCRTDELLAAAKSVIKYVSGHEQPSSTVNTD